MEQTILAVCTLVSDLRSIREVTSGCKLLKLVGEKLNTPTIPHLLQVDLGNMRVLPNQGVGSSVKTRVVTRVGTRYDAWTLRNSPEMLAILEQVEGDSVFPESILDLTHICAYTDMSIEPDEPFLNLDHLALDIPRVADEDLAYARSNGLLLRNHVHVRWITVEGGFFWRGLLLGRCKGLRFHDRQFHGYAMFATHDYRDDLPSWRGVFDAPPQTREMTIPEIRAALAAYGR